MKKMIFISTLTTLSLFASNINIANMEDNPERQTPPKGNIILSYHSAIANVKKSVVNISTTKKIAANPQYDQMLNNPLLKEFFGNQLPQLSPQQRKASSLGSGVIISSDGYIVTNNHVVEDADTILVTMLDDSKEYEAKIVGTDPKTDLAVVKIEAKDLNQAQFGDSEDLLEGDIVFAIGNPFGVGGSVTQGIVSALNKHGIGLNQYENFIQTDASINPGNSGGALVDSRGALIGINSAILSRSGGNNGIGFAIPSNMVQRIAKNLIENGKIERGYIGVSISDLTKDLKEIYSSEVGALVLNVEADSPAFKAGIKRGDLIIRVDDEKVSNANDLMNIVGNKTPGKVVKVKFERNNKMNNVSITLANMDKNSQLSTKEMDYIDGLSVENLDENLRYKYQTPNNIRGVVITAVKPQSKAQELGFMPADVIVQIDQTLISDIKTMVQALKNNKNKKVIYVYRNGFVKRPFVVK